MKALEQKNDFSFLLLLPLKPSFLETFENEKTGVIYMSIAFHSYITSKNRLKNEQAT